MCWEQGAASSSLRLPGVVPAAIPAGELSGFTPLLPSAHPRTFPCSCISMGMFGKCNYCKSVTSSFEALWAWNLLSSNRILVFKLFYDLLFSRCWSVSCFILFDNLFPLKGLSVFFIDLICSYYIFYLRSLSRVALKRRFLAVLRCPCLSPVVPQNGLLSLSAAGRVIFLLMSCHTVQHSIPGRSQCLLSELIWEHVTCPDPFCTYCLLPIHCGRPHSVSHSFFQPQENSSFVG